MSSDNISYELKDTKINDTLKTNIDSFNVFFKTKVEDYIKNNKIHLFILTPCYGGLCHINYVNCLLETVNLFRSVNIPLSIQFCKNDSLVSRARNNLIAKAMSNTESTHFMFIDADITWDPVDILKLIISDKSLIGGVYPLKRYAWERFTEKDYINKLIERKNKSQLKDIITNENMIQYNLLKYNVNFLDNVLQIDNNITKVKHIATGFMMIKRSTIEQMSKAFPSTKYTDDVGFLVGKENEYAYALFDCGVEDDHYYSEDWLFCHRWSKMGGNIYLDVSINLTHTGNEDYAGSFISSLI
jgi:hypothetical protein